MNASQSNHIGPMSAPAATPLPTRNFPRIGMRPGRGATVCALALGGLLHVLSAQAVEFGSGGLQGSFDTTLSHGVAFRVSDRDSELAVGVNDNDGNLNYDKGLISNTSKFTSDLELDYGNFGAFVRVTGFIDFENENGQRERTPLSEAAKDQVGKDIELLDAYVTGSFDAGDIPIDARIGNHVLNWGESTFIQNGINAINPFDVGQLRLPGSELREALVPVPLISVSVAPTDVLSVEGFYQLDWEETEIDPVGSYFSTTDYVGDGATRAVIPLPGITTDRGFGFGPLTPAINADLTSFQSPAPPGIPGVPPGTIVPNPQSMQMNFDSGFANVIRGADREPEDSGQWGIALRYLAERLNDTEFGFYFMNYHSRLPLISATTGSRAGVLAGLFAAQAVGAPTSTTAAAIAGSVIDAVTQQITAQVTAGVPAGTPPAMISQLVAAELANPETQSLIGDTVQTQVSNVASVLAIDRYVDTGEYFIEYPEDIQLLGLSFNALLGATGWALQGEYSFRPDAPLQRAEDALFADGLAPVLRVLDPTRPDYISPENVPSYLATYQPTIVQGYIERDVSQIQATATKVFGPVLGSDSGAFVTEVALMHVHDIPDKDVAPLESPAGSVGDDPNYADATSWGYRLAARLDYNNAIGAVNLFPYVQFGHDVSGNSPSPSGSFVEGRTALTLGLRADYLSRWGANLNYTIYNGDANELRDRDFVSFSASYSF